MRFLILFTSLFFMISCGSGGSNNSADEQDDLCSVSELETELGDLLAQATSEVDFSFAAVRQDGREYEFNRGTSTMQTTYESASTSKLVSAVVIMRLVELEVLSLSDRPQDHIDDWPIEDSDPLFDITLQQLLSFTSGLEISPLCTNVGAFDYETCVNTIAIQNAGNDVIPGEEFYYGNSHLQVAGLMAYNALGVDSWEEAFDEFQTETGLFPNGEFDLPSDNNPRLAGGMHWTGEEYIAFLLALRAGEILNTDSMNLLLTDHTANSEMASSPAFDALMRDWRYGFGLWHECESQVFNCQAGERISSPGAFGAYPYWDRNLDYIGLVARQGALGTFLNGIELERSVREAVEEWVECI